jgi:hypothetical protein
MGIGALSFSINSYCGKVSKECRWIVSENGTKIERTMVSE